MMATKEAPVVCKYSADSDVVQGISSTNQVKSVRRSSRKRKADGNESIENAKNERSSAKSSELIMDHTLPSVRMSLPSKLTDTDFSKCSINLAKYLIGKVLTRVYDDGKILSGRIVETEAYLGEQDKACHTYGGKRTERTQPMYMKPGTLYVYFIYGMYHCLNISSQDVGGCVLIRALEPLQGKDTMRKLRCARSASGKSSLKDNQLCNGPSKLCLALSISKDFHNKEDLVTSDSIWIEKDNNVSKNLDIVVTKRIGIDSYGYEWASKPFRFYLVGSNSISIRDRNAEQEYALKSNK